ncbi:hypothetical protein [Microbulbifer sp. CNSA002]|uniref:hypothetical protein n=1 Tax=unclassified Microbulbifer TaxID=2619833 RepID=UPI0039B5188C
MRLSFQWAKYSLIQCLGLRFRCRKAGESGAIPCLAVCRSHFSDLLASPPRPVGSERIAHYLQLIHGVITLDILEI